MNMIYVWIDENGNFQARFGGALDVPASHESPVLRIEFEQERPVIFDHHNHDEIGVM